MSVVDILNGIVVILYVKNGFVSSDSARRSRPNLDVFHLKISHGNWMSLT